VLSALRAAGPRRFRSFKIAPANPPWSLRPRKVSTSSACRQSVAWSPRRGAASSRCARP